MYDVNIWPCLKKNPKISLLTIFTKQQCVNNGTAAIHRVIHLFQDTVSLWTLDAEYLFEGAKDVVVSQRWYLRYN